MAKAKKAAKKTVTEIRKLKPEPPRSPSFNSTFTF